MTPADAPEPLYETPGPVKGAQTIAFLQVVTLFGIGTTLSTVGSLGTWLTRLLEFFTDADVAVLHDDAFAVQLAGWTMLGAAVILGVLTWGIGAGKRWAQIGLAVLETALGASIAVGTGLLGNQALALVTVPFAVIPALGSVVLLVTGSANQWFAQHGWEPWYRRYYEKRNRA
ncbi:hypothetical protein [Glycomyces paridis]|uniref:Uncharacterized protein n=1 Tax=Glycomyces paridis TaxID=2126555 RepID=A0A4S8PCD3_9ACTN|nr:hypothetical protein [Glycomyces paridis]THV27977.1 hypothetical protein E9998_13400 [Glycomyces paridis]